MQLLGLGFVKQAGFKQGVKEREGVMDVQSGESQEEEVEVTHVSHAPGQTNVTYSPTDC